MSPVTLALVLFLQLLVLAAMLALFRSFVIGITSVPWVRTPRWKTRRILAFAGLRPGERLLDLGSGDGSIVIDSVRDFDAIGNGIETQWVLVGLSRIRARIHGVSDHARFMRASMFRASLPDADVIFVYLFPKLNARLEPILKNRYPSGTRIVSRAFSFPTFPLVAKEKLENETIYLYRVP